MSIATYAVFRAIERDGRCSTRTGKVHQQADERTSLQSQSSYGWHRMGRLLWLSAFVWPIGGWQIT
jgi:hypothetical protein